MRESCERGRDGVVTGEGKTMGRFWVGRLHSPKVWAGYKTQHKGIIIIVNLFLERVVTVTPAMVASPGPPLTRRFFYMRAQEFKLNKQFSKLKSCANYTDLEIKTLCI